MRLNELNIAQINGPIHGRSFVFSMSDSSLQVCTGFASLFSTRVVATSYIVGHELERLALERIAREDGRLGVVLFVDWGRHDLASATPSGNSIVFPLTTISPEQLCTRVLMGSRFFIGTARLLSAQFPRVSSDSVRPFSSVWGTITVSVL